MSFKQVKIGRITEDLEKQLVLLKSERRKAKVTEKLSCEIRQKLLPRLFTLYDRLFAHEETGVKSTNRNMKKLAVLTQSDVGICEDHLKTKHQAYAILKVEKAVQTYKKLGLENAE